MTHITWEQFLNFKEYYEKMHRVAPDYRVGQAFLNYFPDLDKAMIKESWSDEFHLYHEKSDDVCWARIRNMVK